MKEPKYKVGDWVVVLDGSNIPDYVCGWTRAMALHVGKRYKVFQVQTEPNFIGYKLGGTFYTFDERGLSPAEEYCVKISVACSFGVDRIIRNENATVVMWKDGTKTIVHKAEGTEDSPYAAFTAALAIKCYGSNSEVNRIVRKTEKQKSKKEKAEEKKRKKTLSQLTEEVTINLVQMKCENCKYIDKACATEYKKGEAYFCEHKGKYVFPDKYCLDFEPEM